MNPEVKFFEVRDSGTHIPVMCVRFSILDLPERQQHIARRGGWGPLQYGLYYIKLAYPQTQFDAYEWSDRTNQAAHLWIEGHWNELEDGALIDVRVCLDESDTPCESDYLELESKSYRN